MLQYKRKAAFMSDISSFIVLVEHEIGVILVNRVVSEMQIIIV